MSDAYIGEIRMFAGNYAPVGWMMCQGQVLPISQYTALFSILGATYGGNGVSDFALPHFGGRMPVGLGKAPTVTTSYVLGQVDGAETVTVLASNMPAHTHTLGATSQQGVTNVPGPSTYLAAVTDAAGSPVNIYGDTGNASTPLNTTLAPQSLSVTGGSAPLDIRNPYLALSFIICVSGEYPPHP
ncbi:phage tail protein [Pseudomonas sp. S32]|uniref:phage tail protein n=1 Tax=Pseudomonas sp. S32 TaxID=2767448 RepID=UPI00191354C1|nr:tail fiber protein [Pseudomonas sp. S32]MBK5007314.1 phage tail protein [Pseudomonas sp. S32]